MPLSAVLGLMIGNKRSGGGRDLKTREIYGKLISSSQYRICLENKWRT